MSAAEHAAQYPATAIMKARKNVSSQVQGSKNAYSRMQSDMNVPGDPVNSRALARAARMPAAPIANFDPNDTNVSAGYQQKATAMQNAQLRQQPYLQAMTQENERFGKFAQFDREIYTNQRLDEMQPTADIDKAILDLRNKSLFSQASMYDEVKSLPYNLQRQVIASRMAVFTDQIDQLSDMREGRMAAAKNQITDEVGTYEGKISASKARIEGLGSALNILKDQGASEESMAQLRIDHAREMDKLKKSRAGGGGRSTGEEMIYNMFIEQHQADNGGQMPDKDQMSEYARKAKFAAKHDPKAVEDAVSSGGRFTRPGIPASLGGGAGMQIIGQRTFGGGSLRSTPEPSIKDDAGKIWFKTDLEMRKLAKDATSE